MFTELDILNADIVEISADELKRFATHGSNEEVRNKAITLLYIHYPCIGIQYIHTHTSSVIKGIFENPNRKHIDYALKFYDHYLLHLSKFLI